MIGYCMLTLRQPVHPDVWRHYFKGDNSRLWVHSKRRHELGPFFAERSIPTQPTAWGDISITRQMNRLATEAFKDKRIEKVVFISGQCLPAHQMRFVEGTLLSCPQSMLEVWDTPKRLPVKGNYPLAKSATWMAIERKDWQDIFVKDTTADFEEVHIADEHYHIMRMMKAGRGFENYRVTYTDFPHLPGKPAPHPRTFDVVNLPPDAKALFMRKVSRQSTLSPAYLHHMGISK